MTDYTPNIDLRRAAGSALLVGFLLVIVVLYGRNPSAALDTATASVGGVAYFLVLPALGLFAGVYAYVDGPFAGLPTFVFGSYLGVFGVGLAFGTLAAATPSLPLLLAGVGAVVLAVTALVATLLRLVGAVSVGVPGVPSQ